MRAGSSGASRADLFSALEDMIKFVECESYDAWHGRGRWGTPIRQASPVSFAKELRTVKFGVTRRAGHTTMAVKYARRNMKQVHMILFSRDQISLVEDPPDNLTVFTQHQYDVRGKTWGDVNVVIVDCASQFSKKRLDRIYHAYAGRCPGARLLGHWVENTGDTPLFILLE